MVINRVGFLNEMKPVKMPKVRDIFKRAGRVAPPQNNNGDDIPPEYLLGARKNDAIDEVRRLSEQLPDQNEYHDE